MDQLLTLKFTYNDLKALECLRNACKEIEKAESYVCADLEEGSIDPKVEKAKLELFRIENVLMQSTHSLEHILGGSEDSDQLS